MSNRLKDQTSPYLLQHAENPVDWFPWSTAAFQKAESEDKPVFLSIGYAACHWCHVMAHESFEDPEVAAIMNDHFVNVKVDREERPDVDAIYMQAVTAMTGYGGWPMSVFLTPQGKPFYGGTYFPPVRRHDMPSFREVLLGIARAWREERDDLLAASDRLTDQLSQTPALRSADDSLQTETLHRAAEALLRTYDWVCGGWGGAPKFPSAMTVEFLLRHHHRVGDPLARDMALHTLQAMARGGIFDHLGGGFHRYAVDERWLVPHFEKMLYDNALLARAYLHAWHVSGDQTLLQTFEATIDFLLREMRHPQGGFFASLDADAEGEEGTFYLWTPEQIQVVLPPEDAQLFMAAYDVSEAGDFEGRNVLHLTTSVEELSQRFGARPEQIDRRLRTSRAALLEAREHRTRPALDDKIITSWNGLALMTLAQGARVLRRPDLLQAAQRLASFLLDNLMPQGRLMRSWYRDRAQHTAYLEDHAALGLAMLELYQSDFDNRWYQAAIHQAEEILSHFADPEGGFFDTRDESEPLITRPKGLQDSPTASGNTLAVSLLLRLGALTGDQRYTDPALQAATAMQAMAVRYPTGFSGWLCALDFALGPIHQLALLGDPADARFQALHAAAAKRFTPRLVMAGGDPGAHAAPSLLAHRELLEGRPTAYLCQRFSCKLPVTSPGDLAMQLEEP